MNEQNPAPKANIALVVIGGIFKALGFIIKTMFVSALQTPWAALAE